MKIFCLDQDLTFFQLRIRGSANPDSKATFGCNDKQNYFNPISRYDGHHVKGQDKVGVQQVHASSSGQRACWGFQRFQNHEIRILNEESVYVIVQCVFCKKGGRERKSIKKEKEKKSKSEKKMENVS